MADERKYYFDRAEDMISLAQYIEIEVYWGHRFYTPEDEDESDPTPYRFLWDFIEEAYGHGDGAKGIIICDDKHVKFFN